MSIFRKNYHLPLSDDTEAAFCALEQYMQRPAKDRCFTGHVYPSRSQFSLRLRRKGNAGFGNGQLRFPYQIKGSLEAEDHLLVCFEADRLLRIVAYFNPLLAAAPFITYLIPSLEQKFPLPLAIIWPFFVALIFLFNLYVFQSYIDTALEEFQRIFKVRPEKSGS